MISLDKDLQEPKLSLNEFGDLTIRVLQYLPNVISSFKEKNDYKIYASEIAGTTKYIRPINHKLYIQEEKDFLNNFDELKVILGKIKLKSPVSDYEKIVIDKTLYTIQQSIGAGLDLLVKPNSARKHVGNRFEELIKVVFSEIGIANKKIILKIPYETNEGTKTYKCENDLILSPFDKVRSSSKSLDENEIVVSIKTTSKDRMGKMFIDKILLERFVEHPQKVIGVFLNDVQRKESDNISFTLVSGLFMVYSKFLTKLDGIYYLDPPPTVRKEPYSKYMKPFSELITNDINNILTS
ncbi:MAG: hypothetical protein K8R86_01205 [Bacteroidales bacterium]|nr:hypothetical protein [Bacteroidales bacterium]